jgi:hypothetical protein
VAFQNIRLPQHCLHLNAAYAKTSASAERRPVTMRLKNMCCEQALDRLYLHRCFRSFLIMKGICISDLKKQAFTAVVLRHTPSLLSSDKSGLCQNSFNTLMHMGLNFRRIHGMTNIKHAVSMTRGHCSAQEVQKTVSYIRIVKSSSCVRVYNQYMLTPFIQEPVAGQGSIAGQPLCVCQKCTCGRYTDDPCKWSDCTTARA